MKLKIDFTNKIITVEEQCNAAELFAKLQELFPNDAWKEYKLETPINWQYYPNWWTVPCAPIPVSPTFDVFPVTICGGGTGDGIISVPSTTTNSMTIFSVNN